MNWKTSLFGIIAVVCGVLVAAPELVGTLIGNDTITKKVLALCALVSGIYAATSAKDKNVTGNGSSSSPFRKAPLMVLMLLPLALSSCGGLHGDIHVTGPGGIDIGGKFDPAKPLHSCVAVKPDAVKNGLEAWGERSKFWPQNTVLRIQFLAGNAGQKAKALKCFQRVAALTNISFKVVTHPPSEVRVRFDYNNGHWSYVGKDCLGIAKTKPTMNLALKSGWFGDNTDEWHRVAQHEFLHTLGLLHEQQSPNSSIPWNVSAVLDYYRRTQGWSDAEIHLQVLDREAMTSDFSGTAFDPTSIMEYPIPAELTTNGFSVGWNRELSATDIKFLQSIYPPKKA